jgi:hypothetical protein
MKVIPKGGQRPTFSFYAKNKDKFPQKNLTKPYESFDNSFGAHIIIRLKV